MNQTTSNPSTSITPDAETVVRIKNLAAVGTALYEITSESGFQTDHFVAKEALIKFKVGIERLELDAESRKGMMNLIAYLDKKIDKRLNASQHGTSLD